MLGIAEHVLDEDMAQRIARALPVFEFLQIDTKRLAAIVEYVRQELMSATWCWSR